MYFLKKDRFGNHVLTKEGEKLYAKFIVHPPRQHGKPRRFHPPILAASHPAWPIHPPILADSTLSFAKQPDKQD